MGKTLVEKIISRNAGREVRAGDLVVCPVDMVMIHDGTGILSIKEFQRLERGGADSGQARTHASFLGPYRTVPTH